MEIKEIELSNIYVPQSVKGTTVNKARYKGLNSNHINKLAESLSKGIDYSKPLLIVVKKEQWVDGKYYEYELVAGVIDLRLCEKIRKHLGYLMFML